MNQHPDFCVWCNEKIRQHEAIKSVPDGLMHWDCAQAMAIELKNDQYRDE